MNKKTIKLLMALIIVAIVGSFIVYIYIEKGETEEKNDVSQISAVTSFYPTYIIALNITDQIPELKVNSLTDFSAGCLHDYQLTTGDMKILSTADVFLMNGGGMEGYIEEVVENYPDLNIVNISMDIPMLDSDEHEGEVNPHVWLDPTRYSEQISNMKDGLVQYVESHADLSQETKNKVIQQLNTNAEAYLEKVSVLEKELNDLQATVKESDRNQKVVIFHETFTYIADRVGLDVAHTVEIDSDTSLSAGEIAEVIDLVKKEQIEFLFTEEQYGSSITDRIEEETEAIAYVIDSAVTGDGSKDSYLEAMNKNLEFLREAFK